MVITIGWNWYFSEQSSYTEVVIKEISLETVEMGRSSAKIK